MEDSFMNSYPLVVQIDGKHLRRLTPSELWVLGHIPYQFPLQLYGQLVIRLNNHYYYWDESPTLQLGVIVEGIQTKSSSSIPTKCL